MSDITPAAVLAALARHIGRAQGVRADRLVAEITGHSGEDKVGERRLREVIMQLRNEGHHICGYPGGGYWIALTPEELDATCLFLYGRAMTTLQQIAAMKRVSMPDLRGQLHLPT